VIAKDPCEIRIVGLMDGGVTWRPVSVAVSSADKSAGVTAELKQDGGLLRVTVKSPVSRDVKWIVKFAK
jgi:hypothetical protein